MEWDLNREFSIEETQVAEKLLKKCLTSLSSRDLGFHLTPDRRAKINNRSDSSAGKDAEQEDHSSIT